MDCAGWFSTAQPYLIFVAIGLILSGWLTLMRRKR